MNELTKDSSNFIGYEYKEFPVQSGMASMYMDSYSSFGWLPDKNITSPTSGGQILVRLKRDRKILNKAELTRLQRHFEACMEEIVLLEKSKTSLPKMVSIGVGIAGTAFMALSTFSVTNTPPNIALCVLSAIPGFIGWVLPYFIYKTLLKRRGEKLAPLIRQKFDEVYEICEKGNNLLSK